MDYNASSMSAIGPVVVPMMVKTKGAVVYLFSLQLMLGGRTHMGRVGCEVCLRKFSLNGSFPSALDSN